jgi:endonuclease YncB( thermonuclease family)
LKRFILFILGLLISVSANAVPAEVAYIVDGDTFAAKVMLQDDIKISVRVRIINIDSPEISGGCDAEIKMAYLAKERLSRIIPVGSMVDLSKIKDDKYLGRIDARVAGPDGLDVGEILVREKLARSYNGGKRQSWCAKKTE